MRILSRKTGKQMCGNKLGSACGSRTEVMQITKNILNLLMAVIHENKSNAAGSSENVVHFT